MDLGLLIGGCIAFFSFPLIVMYLIATPFGWIASHIMFVALAMYLGGGLVVLFLKLWDAIKHKF